MAKRKYTKHGETPKAYECTNRKCKWQGTDDEKALKGTEKGYLEHVCPECKNNEFYGLLENPNVCMLKCESCENEFDMDTMITDSADCNFCKECWDELEPTLQREYEELKEKGEID